MSLAPTNLERIENRGLRISWSDGTQDEFSVKALRDACPCATCRQRRNNEEEAEAKPSSGPMSLPILSAEEARPLEITGMKPVGNYAYNIAFSDGHDTGIFTFDLLKEIASE